MFICPLADISDSACVGGSGAGVGDSRLLSQDPMDFEVEDIDPSAEEGEGNIGDEYMEETVALPQGSGTNAPAEVNEMLHGDEKKGQHWIGVQTRSSMWNTRPSSNSFVLSSQCAVRKRKCCPTVASEADVSDSEGDIRIDHLRST